MSNYDDNMKGVLWKNDKREKDTQPHFKGECTIDGVEYWMVGWKRGEDDPSNRPPLKLAFTKKDDVHKQGVEDASQAAQGNSEPEFDDDIPF